MKDNHVCRMQKFFKSIVRICLTNIIRRRLRRIACTVGFENKTSLNSTVHRTSHSVIVIVSHTNMNILWNFQGISFRPFSYKEMEMEIDSIRFDSIQFDSFRSITSLFFQSFGALSRTFRHQHNHQHQHQHNLFRLR